MIKFTFLTKDQVYGKNQLDMFKKYGTKSALTDLCILQNCNIGHNDYVERRTSLKCRTGSYWLRDSSGKGVSIIKTDGTNDWNDVDIIWNGARVVVDYSSIKPFASHIIVGKKDLCEVEYGEYPQMAVTENLSRLLEKKFKEKTLNTTDKKYKFKIYDSGSVKLLDVWEYELDGSKYIRYPGEYAYGGRSLSNGMKISSESEDNEFFWIKVEPIRWFIDAKNDIAVSKKILFSGIQFDLKNGYKGDFENTEIKHYMDNYFSFDIKPGFKNQTSKNKVLVNPYEFNFDKVSEEEIIRGAIESDIAVFLHGKSSEGKSARVKQIDPDCIIIYLRNATPESLNGKSVYNSEKNELIDIKPSWLKKLEEKCNKEPDKNHIVFFDEITNALPSIQGIAFNIILDKEINGIWKLPENARIVAAGNDIEDSLAANRLAEPLFNRFAHVYIETTVENWLNWANENHIHPAIYAFISYKKGTALRTKYDGKLPNADPRKWEMASKVLYKTGRPEMIRSLVGETITSEFISFCKQKVITLDDVIKGNYTKKDLEMNVSEKYATVIGLTHVDEENLQIVRGFLTQLGQEFCKMFDILWVNNDEDRLEILSEKKLQRIKGWR